MSQPDAPGRILVAYATRSGATREIAEFVAQAIRQQGYTAEIQPVEAVADVAAYDAIILGSALYFQRLMPTMLRFITQHGPALAARPVALFSVGAEVRTGTDKSRAAAERWVRGSLSSLPGFQPLAIEHFAGAVELRRLSLLWKILVIITFGQRGDWRNFPAVQRWVEATLPRLAG